MEQNFLNTNINFLVKQRNLFILLFALSFLSNLMLSLTVFTQDTLTVLVPIGLEEEANISRKKLSSSYLQQLTYMFLAHLTDLTPSDISHKKSLLLRYVAPASWAEFNNYFDEQEKKYKEYNLRTSFTPVDLNIDKDNLRVEAKGILKSTFANSGVEEKEITYLISYEYKSGILRLKEFVIKEKATADINKLDQVK